MNLDELKADYEAAKISLGRERNRVDDKARAAASAASNAVRSKHAAVIAALTRDAVDKRAAYEAAVSAAASHPWEGKRVFKMEGSRWGGAPKRIDGIVKVRRVGERPGGANQRTGLPMVGQAYVLGVKKDGSTGVTVIDTLVTGRSKGWELVEGQE